MVDTLIAVAMAVVAVLLGQESRSQGRPELDARAYVLVALAHLPVALRVKTHLNRTMSKLDLGSGPRRSCWRTRREW
ncbi:hypothetical protein [Streptomyces sp. NPDC052107]|uniref:hypothetical protein n=1 Tax=Streptomyces sp. NPDC052107 TaxID=3155632 RepID=UPI0034145AB0